MKNWGDWKKEKVSKIFVVILYGTIFLGFFSCSKPDYSEFTEQADSFLAKSNFQGTVLIAKKDKIIFEKAYGFSDEKNPHHPLNEIQTIYEIGSITKQMTAAAIMQLVERKKISVNQTIDKFFPEYEHGKNITIKMLLNMRSGLTDHINSSDEFFSPEAYKKLRQCERKNLEVEKDFVLINLYDAPVLTKPDFTYFYCNTNYYLLALIIEQVSGLSYDEYLKKNIFEKAKMNFSNSDFQNTTAKGYEKNHYYSIPKNVALGCGDINSCVEDLLKWNLSFTSGKIVSKKSFKEMTDSESYGYGVYCSKNTNSILHSGNTHVFNSYNEFFLDDKISIVVLSNKPQNEQNATMIAGRLKKLMK